MITEIKSINIQCSHLPRKHLSFVVKKYIAVGGNKGQGFENNISPVICLPVFFIGLPLTCVKILQIK